MILHDFHCPHCNTTFEDLVHRDQMYLQHSCGHDAVRCMPAPKVFQEIVPTTKTSKKRKAGYVHSHGDRPKTPGKIQVAVP